MTERLQLRLLGPFELNGVTPAMPQRAKGLIAYLAMYANRSISRDTLATLLWSYSGSAQARQSLRQCLSGVRATLGQAQESLIATRAAIRFTPADGQIDVQRFEALAQSAEPADLAAAAELYRGEFLEGIDINSEPFGEWLTIERSRLASIACETLRRLAVLKSQNGDAASAIAAAQRLLSLDPLREDGHRILMELYAADGRRSDALRQFETCREIIRRQLGVEPDRETLALVEQIKKRVVAAPAPTASPEEATATHPTVTDDTTKRQDHALSEPAEAEIVDDDRRDVAPHKPSRKPAIVSHGRRRKQAHRWLLWGAFGAIAGALCLAIFGARWDGHSDHPLLSEDGPSIVVMPFRDVGEEGQFKFGESIADRLGGELLQLPGAHLISSKTARLDSLKSLDATRIRRELGTAYIVDGSVVSNRPAVHAEATLIRTIDDTVASALTVDVAEMDAGAARDNIVTGLTWSLVNAIIRQEVQRAGQKPAAAQTANDLVWLGWSTLNRNASYEDTVNALSFLEKARNIDAKNVDALAFLANTLLIQFNYPGAPDFQANLLAVDALTTEALTIEPRHVFARYNRCLLLRVQSRYEDALAACRSIVDDLYWRPLAYKEMGLDYLYLGRLDEAISAFTAANHLLEHAGPRWTWLLSGGWAYLQAGSYDDAINWLHQALEARPQTINARVWLIAAYALAGRQQDAATELGKLRRARPDLFSRDDALAGIINIPGSPAFGEHMRSVIAGLEKGGFPERMIKPLRAKTLIPGRPRS